MYPKEITSEDIKELKNALKDIIAILRSIIKHIYDYTEQQEWSQGFDFNHATANLKYIEKDIKQIEDKYKL